MNHPLTLYQRREIEQLGRDMGAGRISWLEYHNALYTYFGA